MDSCFTAKLNPSIRKLSESLVMRCGDDSTTTRSGLEQQADYLTPRVSILPKCRLIDNEHLRLRCDGCTHCKSALLPTRQGERMRIRMILQVQPSQQLITSLLCCPSANAKI
jgi:hypothetical protein